MALSVVMCTPRPLELPLEQPPGWDEAVRLTEAADADPDPAVVDVRLEAKIATVMLDGRPTQMWTYDGVVPGPLIRARVGDTVIVRFTSSLPEPTTVHWHGVEVPAEMDGSEATQAAVPPGGSFEYRFTATKAGTFWYHPHVRSSAQVGFGLYGAIIVEDPAERAYGDDLVLVLSDVSTADAGVLAPGDQHGWFGDYFGREGGLLLVNGKRLPTVKARAGVPQRWKLVNASRARYWSLEVPNAEVLRIGGDVGLIETPQPGNGVVLTPGERAELWVKPLTPGRRSSVTAVDADRFHIGYPQPPEAVLELEVLDEPARHGAEAPSGTLREIVPPDAAAAKPRTFELMDLVDGGAGQLGINGKTYRPDEHIPVRLGDTERWEVHNSTAYDHSFHLHGYAFVPTNLAGRSWPVREWKDSINVPAKQRLELLVRFDDRPGMWMLHCHILDHVELGMMTMLQVRP
ncbi:MAG: multicopper oxidase family protein [Archangiaceae bacterium]|nr:multicopper oxidase family protein [Archangiaceae bacterium]